jgi:hypothetical protein
MKDSAGKPKIEQLLDEINWTSGVGEPAGVYWLEGRSRIAAHDSAAEARLLEQGAILVATLLFERDPREGTRPGSRVERIPSTSLHPMFPTPLHTANASDPTHPLHGLWQQIPPHDVN